VVFADPEDVIVGPVGPAVIVKLFGIDEVELLIVVIPITPAVIEFAFRVTVEVKLVGVSTE
jgi:hypothetical protein